jgi:L-amino acid N-acyltransferase YncA
MEVGIDSWRMVRALSREEFIKSYVVSIRCEVVNGAYFHDFRSRMGFEHIVHVCGLVGEIRHCMIVSM